MRWAVEIICASALIRCSKAAFDEKLNDEGMVSRRLLRAFTLSCRIASCEVVFLRSLAVRYAGGLWRTGGSRDATTFVGTGVTTFVGAWGVIAILGARATPGVASRTAA